MVGGEQSGDLEEDILVSGGQNVLTHCLQVVIDHFCRASFLNEIAASAAVEVVALLMRRASLVAADQSL